MKIFFIINGGRAAVSPGLVARMRKILHDSGMEHRLEVSRTLDESNALVAEAAEEGFDTLWMGGGDGTINVLLNQSMPAHMTLGVVPMGTVNALARALGVPMKPEDACRFLLTAKPRNMNLGCVNGERLFLCFASVGFDAAVVHDVGGAFKRLGGRLAYAAAAAASVFSMKRIVPFHMEPGESAYTIEDGTNGSTGQANTLPAPASDHGYSLVVSNIRNYAGFNLFPDAHPCANSMELWLFRDRRLDAMAVWSAVTLLGLDKWKRHLRRNVGHYFVRSFLLQSKKPMYLQLDGEAVILGDGLRYEFEFQERAVMVLAE
jgi:diacylglycerol kinase family enzyme